MALWAKWIMTGLSLACPGMALALWIGSLRQAKAAAECRRQLLLRSSGGMPATVSMADLAQLPAPVARYFRYALRDGQPAIRVARYRQRGQLRTGIDSRHWLSFDAEQVVVPPSRGFMWHARVGFAPLLHLRVRDAYFAGQGAGQVSALSAITVSQSCGGVEMNSGALHRYLAEAVWYPTALLPAAGVQWTALDEQCALATLTDSGITVSLEFRFNAVGEVTAVYTPGRWGRFKSGFDLKPWEGRFGKYQQIAGMRVPLEGEAGWHASGAWHAVWKGRIRGIAYEFPPGLAPVDEAHDKYKLSW